MYVFIIVLYYALSAAQFVCWYFNYMQTLLEEYIYALNTPMQKAPYLHACSIYKQTRLGTKLGLMLQYKSASMITFV